MPLLNPQLYTETYKIEDIHSITLKSFHANDKGVWKEPVIKITTKKEVEEYHKNNLWIELTEYIEFNKKTGLFYIRRTVDNLSTGYGEYDTLKEAENMVEFLEAHDWNKKDYHERLDGEMYISDCYDDKVCIMCDNNNLVSMGEYVLCQECGMRYKNDMRDNEWWL